MISSIDEAALEWFFGPGLAIYERSTVGAILAKLSRDSATSEPCRRCDGAGILDGAGGFAVTKACEGCGGNGKAPNGRTLCTLCKGFGSGDSRRTPAKAGGWCPSCSGTGATPVDEAKRRRTPCYACSLAALPSGRRQKRARCAGCRNCLGTGEEPVSVRPMHKAAESGGMSANEEALARFAVTSRRVAKVREMSPILADALAAWYGDAGQQCAEDDETRSGLLFKLHAEGRAYLLAVEDKHSGSLQGLRDSADERSAELYMLACRAWNMQARAKGEQRVVARLADSLQRLGYEELGAAVRKVGA